MRVLDWECTINHDGTVRGAVHTEFGAVMWSHKGLMGNAAVPTEVLKWLIRPMLREAWEDGADCYGYTPIPNPYAGEPPNKDHDPS